MAEIDGFMQPAALGSLLFVLIVLKDRVFLNTSCDLALPRLAQSLTNKSVCENTESKFKDTDHLIGSLGF